MSLPRNESRSPQRARLLRELIDARGGEVPLTRILALGIAQYQARLFELRDMGFCIPPPRIETINGQRHSWYRLVSGPSELKKQGTEPRQQPQPALPAMESGALFQNLPMRYRDPEEG
jgi:hypothetical protein